jgi:hypothetical protein
LFTDLIKREDEIKVVYCEHRAAPGVKELIDERERQREKEGRKKDFKKFRIQEKEEQRKRERGNERKRGKEKERKEEKKRMIE